MSSISRYTVPIPVLYGPTAVMQVGDVAAEHGVSAPLVITDRGIRECGLLERLLGGLGELRPRTHVFDGVTSNPREEDVLAAMDHYREARADGIIALGGGSAIDAAKAVRLLLGHGGSFTDYEFAKGGAAKITRPMPPLIAVPTTAGTGSEVSRGTLIITRRGDIVRKSVAVSTRLVPTVAVLDPELTLELPLPLTAGTGMDALSHCVEEYLSPRRHGVVAALALGAFSKIVVALPRLRRCPDDLEARGEMLEAAMMAAIGFEKGLGVIMAS